MAYLTVAVMRRAITALVSVAADGAGIVLID
jgi:hypothetical protein